MRLSTLTTADLPEVHALNQANVPHVGALDAAGFAATVGHATVALVLRDEVGVAGFVLAMDPFTAYGSPNYRWFCARGDGFLYVDRIAVAERCRGRGLGRQLYEAVSDAARDCRLGAVTCEVNTLPPNPDSLAFHARLGFRRVGELVHEPGEKAVAMLEVELAPR